MGIPAPGVARLLPGSSQARRDPMGESLGLVLVRGLDPIVRRPPRFAPSALVPPRAWSTRGSLGGLCLVGYRTGDVLLPHSARLIVLGRRVPDVPGLLPGAAPYGRRVSQSESRPFGPSSEMLAMGTVSLQPDLLTGRLPPVEATAGQTRCPKKVRRPEGDRRCAHPVALRHRPPFGTAPPPSHPSRPARA